MIVEGRVLKWMISCVLLCESRDDLIWEGYERNDHRKSDQKGWP